MSADNAMDLPCKVESGLQLLARLNTRPGLAFFHQELFRSGPDFNEVIEMCYDLNTHHITLLCEILCNVLLPEELGGKNAGIIVLLTDGHFDLIQLVATLNFLIEQRNSPQCESPDSIVSKCLSNIHILHAYDSQQMTITIQNLENMLSSDMKISLVVIDTISAFYWADRMANSSLSKMDTYVKKILRSLQLTTKEYKSVILYTRPSYFISKVSNTLESAEACAGEPGPEKVNWRITLSAPCLSQGAEDHGNAVTVRVATSQNTITKAFVVKDLEIIWT